MNRSLPLATLVLASTALAQNAQDPQQKPQQKTQQARPVIVTPTRSASDPIKVPYSTEVIDTEQLERRSYRTVPQAFRDVPGVMIQETAHGHGSPYIRGFTSFRTLFLIDGIRLNNSVFRPGPNQYWATVDPYSLDSLEIVKGPSSTLYGTDAIGGTVNARTRGLSMPTEKGYRFGGRTRLRYSSAEDSIQGRAEVFGNVGYADGTGTSFLVGGTARAFGDLEGGGGIGTQPETGYDETDMDIKIDHWLDKDRRFTFLHQRVDQNAVPRTHRTVNGINWRGTTNGSDLVREFNQNRELTYLQYHDTSAGGMFDEVHATLSYHRQRELRNRVRSNSNREHQGFDVATVGALLSFVQNTDIGRLTYGFDIYRDDVDSFRRRLDAPGSSDWIQGPVADDATYDIMDVYVQDQIEVTRDLDVILGARFSYVSVDADSVRDPITSNRIQLSDNWDSIVGNARFSYKVAPDTSVFGGVSQGFRAPNLSDLSRFDTARTNEFEIPAPNLDAEKYIQYEVGVKARREAFALQASWFYTDIEDQILRFPTGNTNASGDAEVTKANIGDGHIQGVELGAAVDVTPEWSTFGNVTWMYGRLTNFDSGGSNLQNTYPTRLMPLTAQVGVRFEPTHAPIWCELVCVHAEEQDKLSFSDQRDTSRIPAGGTPGFTVFHWRSGWEISESTSFTALLENITDVDYRIHGSGLNRPGRNFVFGMTTTF